MPLESRGGTRDDFADMVTRCRAAGVGIYVDAVLNHTTAQASGTGSAGTTYSKYEHPGLFEAADFHLSVTEFKYEGVGDALLGRNGATWRLDATPAPPA